MKGFVTGLSLGVLVLAVGACSEKSADADKPQGAIPQHQLDAMEKAKAVEDTLKEADAARRTQADE